MSFFSVVSYIVPFMCAGKVCCLIMNMHWRWWRLW